MLQFRLALGWRRSRRGEVDGAIFRSDPASYRQRWPYPGREFRRYNSERVALVLKQFRPASLAVEGIAEGLLERSFIKEGRRHPYVRRSRRLQNFDARCYLKGPPTVRRAGQ